MQLGKVFLVGAGPGDPLLITMRGVNALQQADVVLYDRLVHPDLLRHAPDHAERIYVGKEPGNPSRARQEHINQLLIDYACGGRVVVRLKGGDPVVFGRGGEEVLALSAAGIPFEVIPGVSAAVAAAEAALIPVTHRGTASAFAVFAGHEAEGNAGGIDWEVAARIPTAVFLMGVERLPEIVTELIAHGRSASTAVAVIEKGTLSSQRVYTGTLQDIVQRASKAQAPAAIVVGEVVGVRSKVLANTVRYARLDLFTQKEYGTSNDESVDIAAWRNIGELISR